MKLFLDTSSLVKLYYKEAGTEALDAFLRAHAVERIYLSEISKVEFCSAVYKKLRMKEIEESDALALLNGFKDDYGKYSFVKIDEGIVESARDFIVIYGSRGLRALDAIQLSCAIAKKDEISTAKTADENLEAFLKQEGVG